MQQRNKINKQTMQKMLGRHNKLWEYMTLYECCNAPRAKTYKANKHKNKTLQFLYDILIPAFMISARSSQRHGAPQEVFEVSLGPMSVSQFLFRITTARRMQLRATQRTITLHAEATQWHPRPWTLLFFCTLPCAKLLG